MTWLSVESIRSNCSLSVCKRFTDIPHLTFGREQVALASVCKSGWRGCQRTEIRIFLVDLAKKPDLTVPSQHFPPHAFLTPSSGFSEEYSVAFPWFCRYEGRGLTIATNGSPVQSLQSPPRIIGPFLPSIPSRMNGSTRTRASSAQGSCCPSAAPRRDADCPL